MRALDGPLPIDAAERAIAEACARALGARRRGGRSAPSRIVVPIEPTCPFTWLASHPPGARLLWSDARADRVVAGSGTASRRDWPDATEAVSHAVGSSGAGGLLGSFVTARFDAARDADARWAPFGIARTVVPALALTRSGDNHALVANIGPAGVGPVLTALAPERRAPAPERPAGSIAPPRADHVPPARWVRAVTHVLSDIERGRLRKLVLSRPRRVETVRRIDPVALAHALATSHPGAFVFCVEPHPSRAFVGASPELLYRRRERTIVSEALAGTRARGENEGSDRALADELLASGKDRLEHAHVANHVERALGQAGGSASKGPIEVRALANVQHLRQRFETVLETSPGPSWGVDEAIVAALHPTPAVSGRPRDRALAALRELEPFDRGLYGGAIGWIDAEGVALAAAIRCALVEPHALTLFAGAGIVPGSEPGAEWAETGAKMNAILDVLCPPS